MGKYQRDEDSDGDSIYMKVQKQNIHDHERTRTMECKKTARIAKDEDMESMMAQIDEWFESNEPGQGSAGAPKPPMKKPARAPKALPDPNVPGPGDLPPLGHEPDPAILAKQKGNAMIKSVRATLDKVILAVSDVGQQKKRGASLLIELKEIQAQMKANATMLQKSVMISDAKINPTTVKNQCVSAQTLIDKATELIHLSKPI